MPSERTHYTGAFKFTQRVDNYRTAIPSWSVILLATSSPSSPSNSRKYALLLPILRKRADGQRTTALLRASSSIFRPGAVFPCPRQWRLFPGSDLPPERFGKKGQQQRPQSFPTTQDGHYDQLVGEDTPVSINTHSFLFCLRFTRVSYAQQKIVTVPEYPFFVHLVNHNFTLNSSTSAYPKILPSRDNINVGVDDILRTSEPQKINLSSRFLQDFVDAPGLSPAKEK